MLKLVFVLASIGLIFGAHVPAIQRDIDPYILEGVINSTLEEVRAALPEVIALDDLPLEFPDSDDAIIVGNAELSNFELTGIKEFQIPDLNLAVIGLRLNLTFVIPSLNINTDYNGDMVVAGLVPIYGKGKANIHIDDLEIKISAQANLTSGIQVQGLFIELFIGSSTFDIQGALNDEDFSNLLSEVLNDVISTFVDNHQEFLTNLISDPIEQLINSILAGTDTSTTEAVLLAAKNL